MGDLVHTRARLGGGAADVLPGRPRLRRRRLVGEFGLVYVQRPAYGVALLVAVQALYAPQPGTGTAASATAVRCRCTRTSSGEANCRRKRRRGHIGRSYNPLMRRAIVVALAVASTIAIAAPALADDTDTDFLNALHRHGISNSASEDQGLIKLGHKFLHDARTGLLDERRHRDRSARGKPSQSGKREVHGQQRSRGLLPSIHSLAFSSPSFTTTQKIG